MMPTARRDFTPETDDEGVFEVRLQPGFATSA
jgi:hypothetical protein